MKKLLYLLPFFLLSCQDNIVEESATIASDPTTIQFVTKSATRAYIDEVTTFPVQAYVDGSTPYFFDTYTIGKGFPEGNYHFWPTKGQVGFFSVVGTNNVTYTPYGPIYSMYLQSSDEDVLVAEKWQSMDQGSVVELAFNHDLSRICVESSIKNLPDGYSFCVDGVEFSDMPMSGTRESRGWQCSTLTYDTVVKGLRTNVTSETTNVVPWFTVLPGYMTSKITVHYRISYPNGYVDTKTLEFDKVIKDGKEVPIKNADLWYESGTGYVYTIKFAVDASEQGEVDVPIYTEIEFKTVVNPWSTTEYTVYTDPVDAPSVLHKTFSGYYWDPQEVFVTPDNYDGFETWLWWDPNFERYEDMHYDNPYYSGDPADILRTVLSNGSAVIRMFDSPAEEGAWYVWDNFQSNFKITGNRVTCDLKYVPLIEVSIEEVQSAIGGQRHGDDSNYCAIGIFTSNTGKINYHLTDARHGLDMYNDPGQNIHFYRVMDNSIIGHGTLLVISNGSLYVVLPE